MYKLPRRVIGAFAALALVVVALTAAGAVQAANGSVCAKVANSCTEWIALGHGSARALIYTTFPLDVPNPRVRRALIMVHGALRNPGHSNLCSGFPAYAWDTESCEQFAFRAPFASRATVGHRGCVACLATLPRLQQLQPHPRDCSCCR